MMRTLPKQSADSVNCLRGSLQDLLRLVSAGRPLSLAIVRAHLEDIISDLPDLEHDLLCDFQTLEELAARWDLDDNVVLTEPDEGMVIR